MMICWYPAAETNRISNTCTMAVKYKPKELTRSAYDPFYSMSEHKQ